MITLYELHWSHYCEKIRLALNYMGLPWRAVSIDAFSKQELRAHPLPSHLPNHTVPAIHDARSGAFVMDSTPILRYLAQAYPGSPALFTGDAANRAAIDAKLLAFDSQLSLPARRFGYTQVILECPSLLPRLFLRHRAKGLFLLPGIRRVAAWTLAAMLTKRFEFHRSERLGLYEALEHYLVGLADELEGRTFVVGDAFSAADLALAAQLRPLTIVPFFAEHPALQGLFERHRQVLARWAGEGASDYQQAIAQARARRPPVRRRLRLIKASLPFAARAGFADNDQKAVWSWSIVAAPWHYVVGLRHNKVRAGLASAGVR
jgi:glutathione S-transferase